jgi:RHS repeat-associated protein
VRILPHEAATTLGVTGVVFTVARADGATTAGTVDMSMSYRGFKDAFGGDFASRLRLVSLPACALTDPNLSSCRVQTPVAGARNSLSTAEVSASGLQVGTAAAGAPPAATQQRQRSDPTASAATVSSPMVYALAAASSSPAGSWTATPLSPSGTWTASQSGGDFSWRYPLRVPPGLGGPGPDLKITYSSQSVDGRTGETNAQPSWIGEGFDLPIPYVERSYLSCADDGQPSEALCTSPSDTLTVSLNGRSSTIVRGSAGQYWPAFDDDGWTITRGTGAPNNAWSGEYWLVTTTDGTRYYFGSHRVASSVTANTQSALRVPVFGDDPGEDCYSGVLSTSYCKKAWKWYLDYVVDARGNSMTYYYAKEGNNYAIHQVGREEYDQSAMLDHIDYGQRINAESAPAPAQVWFARAHRCLPNVFCNYYMTPQYYPDTPWDQHCEPSGGCANVSPTFWSYERLDAVTTKIWDAGSSSYKDVDRWQLAQEYPSPGDGTASMLYLRTISPFGMDAATGTWVAGPVTRFDSNGSLYDNRVDYNTAAGVPPMRKWRVNLITNGTGGETWIYYSPQDCSASDLPAGSANNNPRRCFPQWTTNGSSSGFGWFHKYVVTAVMDRDLTGGSPDVVNNYSYSTNGSTTPVLWAHDESLTTNPTRKTWSQWRGYSEVTATVGTKKTVTRYLRGFHGDKAGPSGGIRYVTVYDLDGGGQTDFPGYQGDVLDTVTYNDTAVVTGEVTYYQTQQIAAQNGYFAGTSIPVFRDYTSATTTRIALSSGGFARRTIAYAYNGYHQVTDTNDQGDPAVSTDDICTRTSYVQSPRPMSLVSRTLVYDKGCDVVTGTDKETKGQTNFYDNATDAATAPTQGLITRVDESTGALTAAVGQSTVSITTYDAYGRVLTSKDALNHQTSTVYAPAAGSAATTVTVTNPASHVTTTTFDPRWGVPTRVVDPNGKTTTAAYDPFGRLVKVWLHGRTTAHTPNIEYGYALRASGVNAVVTKKLGPNGNQISSYVLYDGQLRARQTQTPAPVANGGRVVVDTAYDNRGLTAKSSTFWNSASTPTDTLVSFADADIQNQTRYGYDSAGRITSAQLWSANVEKWRTSYAYFGDRLQTTPPWGGFASAAVNDVRGNKIALWQYTVGGPPTGTHQDTSYSYDKLGRLVGMTDPAGNTWSHVYDRQGRETSSVDPDKGTTTSTYWADGTLKTTTDARNAVLSYEYDSLGRKIALWQGAIGTGTKRASWGYDSLAKGQLTSSTRYDNGNAYTSAMSGYNDAYQPTGASVSFPAVEGTLSTQGPWTTGMSYWPDGSVKTQALPAGGALAAETITTNYDDNGFVISSAGLDAYLSSISYYPWGPTYQTVHGTPGKQIRLTTEMQEFSGRLRTHSVQAESQTTPGTFVQVHSDEFSYMNNGLVQQVVERSNGTTVSAQCFTYDQLGRLVQGFTNSVWDCAAGSPGGGQPQPAGPDPYWTNWEYDAVGNRTKQIQHGIGGAADLVTTYAYPAPGAAQPHTLLSATRSGAGTGTDAYTYDAAGNTTGRTVSGVVQTMTWDAEDHLATQVISGQTTSFVYDAAGGRLLRRDPDGTTTVYLGMFELKMNSSGVLSATRYYAANGAVVASRTSAGLTWLESDHVGTAQVAINATTLAASSRRTMPFGEPRGSQPTWANDKGFVGGTNDPTALVHLGAREYDAKTGRFLSVDPVQDLSDPQQWQGYAYAGNSPVSRSDPTGLRACDIGDDCVHGKTNDPPAGDNCSGLSNATAQWNCSNSPGGKSGGQNPKTKPQVVQTVVYSGAGTTLNIYSDGTATINGYVIPPVAGAPDPFALAAEVDAQLVRSRDWKSTTGVRILDTMKAIVFVCRHRGMCGGETSEFTRTVSGHLNALIKAIKHAANPDANWWDDNGDDVMSLAGALAMLTCLVVTDGVCTAVGWVFVGATVADGAYKLSKADSSDDVICTLVDMGYAVATVDVPGARMEGKSLGDTPWEYYFQGSAKQVGAYGGGSFVSSACHSIIG